MGKAAVGFQTAWWGVVGVIQSLVGALIVLALTPVVAPMLLLLWLWRNVALVAMWVQYGRVARVASGMEALFALDSSGARAVISGAAVLRGRVSVDAVRKVLAERIMDARDARGRLLHPKFRQLVERRCGVVVWVWEENFAVESHVHQLRSGLQPCLLQDEEDLVDVMGKRANRPFVRGQAKWEILVAPLRTFGAERGGGAEWSHTAVIVRLHHALGDGRSMVGLIVTALVDPPLGDPRPSPAIQRPFGGRLARSARLLWSLTHLPWVLVRVLVRGDSSVLHGVRLQGQKFLAWSPPVPLDALKRARALAGVSVNDILLTGLAAALHKHFRMEGDCVPPQVMTVIPVDVTAPGTPLSLANRISLCTVPLPTGEMTSLERLQQIHQRINILKTSPDVMANYFALDLISNLLPAALARRALNTHGVTMVSSNMPGPKDAIRLFGQHVDDLMFWIPNKSRTGLGVSMLSYCGRVRCGLNVDSALIHNAEFAQELMDNMAAEVEHVLAELASPAGGAGDHCPVLVEESDQSVITDHGLNYSTDEYSDRSGVRTYSDLRDSSDTRQFLDLEEAAVDLEAASTESNHLLEDFQNERLEIQTIVRSESNLSRLTGEKSARFALSDTNLKGVAYSQER
ncbi:probable diacyglycerol O-acyltransferase tgs1 [Penaeus chinensis]|uniref:probable diacyglycerol O-acyltransferase tgs1 n=1 Tax=Penaeus chinensis TaxID=139456 RepID=UPI001FB7940E|nr:probable diacyglycerol O-acyltransferase tgs1 [Penaeus chinensis]